MKTEKRAGAPMLNTNAKLADQTEKKNCQLSIYCSEKELLKWKSDCKRRGIPFSLYVNMLLNKKRLPPLLAENRDIKLSMLKNIMKDEK